MRVYKLIRQDRGEGRTPSLICRFKAQDYNAALKIAEHIEIFPGVFGDDVVEPHWPMILMLRDGEV